MKTNSNSFTFPKKYLYIFFVLFLIIQFLNLWPLSTLKVNSIEYYLYFLLIGIIYWMFATILIYSARINFLKTNKLYWAVATLFCIIAIGMLSYPIYVYLHVVKLDTSIQLLDLKADSLRKISK